MPTTTERTPRFRVVTVDRATGRERTRTIEAETEGEATERAMADGMVARVERLADPSPPSAPPAHTPGASLATFGAFLVVCGLFLYPLAVAGLVMGVAAVEVSGGKRGRGVALAGAVVVAVGGLILVAVALDALSRPATGR